MKSAMSIAFILMCCAVTAAVLYVPAGARMDVSEGLSQAEQRVEPPSEYRAADGVLEAWRNGGLRGAISQVIAGKADCDQYTGQRRPRRCVREDEQRIQEYFE